MHKLNQPFFVLFTKKFNENVQKIKKMIKKLHILLKRQ
ncbi:hypothetical protein LMOSA_13140 [Listeria monocytogenes str. Scott A]|nr:hypothetical protein LMntsn_0427 [Listeria monocytogenes]EGJ23923.1 hypothetical protein LMOSA_13140 [Listeria monocytogenes str. Scott A]EXL14084.1 hypothetical protein X845_1981 [Listeria monocytogenes Lm_1824]CBY66501.1 hypothetical protein LMOL312_0423 [Listeria monocytogenes L312]CBY69339.1 hypothetical protein LMOATCC19117_0440 [Listeria monocytogenes ATCC 19117]CBY72199.1 hypothetical protein LMOSLCC2378_0432 [Listeria monocytogenes SLCC2378]CBY75075.1 hypothetical protein LMOSLCC25